MVIFHTVTKQYSVTVHVFANLKGIFVLFLCVYFQLQDALGCDEKHSSQSRLQTGFQRNFSHALNVRYLLFIPENYVKELRYATCTVHDLDIDFFIVVDF